MDLDAEHGVLRSLELGVTAKKIKRGMGRVDEIDGTRERYPCSELSNTTALFDIPFLIWAACNGNESHRLDCGFPPGVL